MIRAGETIENPVTGERITFIETSAETDGEAVVIDYRETAPAASTQDMFLDESGNVDPELSRASGLASGVPGSVAGLELAHESFGTLSWKRLLGPAIDLAANGFQVDARLAGDLREYMGNRFGFFALDLTTRELLEELRDRPTPGLEHGRLSGLLEDADQVKFARLQPSDEMSSRSIDGAFELVDRTKLIEEQLSDDPLA